MPDEAGARLPGVRPCRSGRGPVREPTGTRLALIAVSAVGLTAALALWIWLLAAYDTDDSDRGEANVTLPAKPEDPGASPALPVVVMPSAASSSSPASLPAATPSRSLTPEVVPITVAAPGTLFVGEMGELVVTVGANAGLDEIRFSVQFDPDVLQARAGVQGDWAVDVGINPRFAAEVSEEGDRAQVRSTAPGQGMGTSGGSVAIVQFQAVAPGATSVRITDVVVKDLAGRPIPSALSGSSRQVTVEDLPPPQTEAWQSRGVFAESPDPSPVEAGN
jgi:hypothetical protein